MTDKEKIKQEIERRINDLKGYVLKKGSDQRWVTAIDQLTWIKAFIDSLPEENHFEDKSEMVSEDLDRLVISLEETIGTSPHSREVIKEHLRKAAEWQKKRDQETIELAEDHAMLAGMNKMKEEMMKDAVDAIVHQGLYSKYVKECDDEALANVLKNYNSGDKVKIIIV